MTRARWASALPIVPLALALVGLAVRQATRSAAAAPAGTARAAAAGRAAPILAFPLASPPAVGIYAVDPARSRVRRVPCLPGGPAAAGEAAILPSREASGSLRIGADDSMSDVSVSFEFAAPAGSRWPDGARITLESEGGAGRTSAIAGARASTLRARLRPASVPPRSGAIDRGAPVVLDVAWMPLGRRTLRLQATAVLDGAAEPTARAGIGLPWPRRTTELLALDLVLVAQEHAP